jgi:hypothetical protein
MRATLSATRRLNFEDETPNKDGRNNSFLSRSRTPTPLRVVKMTSEMDRLRVSLKFEIERLNGIFSCLSVDMMMTTSM